MNRKTLTINELIARVFYIVDIRLNENQKAN
jgi:hypothetical protein